jgi:hypothetical protein
MDGLFLADVAQRHIEQFDPRLVAGEEASVLGDLAKAHIDRFDGFGCVNVFADLRWVVKERNQA